MSQYYIFILLLAFFHNLYAFDCAAYIKVRHGNVPILLTSPHGATKNALLNGVPVREGTAAKGFVTAADQYTDEITYKISEILTAKGLRPYYVVAAINRAQIDFNRSPDNAYEHLKSGICYQRYHNLIAQSIAAIHNTWANGFMIDVHGQSKYNQYEIIRGTRNQQTITKLLDRYGTDVSESQAGFFNTLRTRAYNVHPKVGEKERYYIGGYTLKKYGSHVVHGIDALQIEINRDIRIDAVRRQQLIVDIADAIQLFYSTYYQVAE